MKLPKTQAETVQFLLMNASRLDDEHFNSLMAKLNEWNVGRNKPKYNQELIDKVHNREAVIEVDDFTIIKDLINFIYPDDPFEEDGYENDRPFYFSLKNLYFYDKSRIEVYQKYFWGTNINGQVEIEGKPRIKTSEFIVR